MLSLRSRLRGGVTDQLRKCIIRKASSSASLGRILSKYPVGLQTHGFSIEEVQPIAEFSIVAVKLKHAKTGSEHLHLHSETDKNNVFLIGFKTNAPNATGVPHILEHTTLCGSYKYPIRDPFFKMLNRSLANFMNAMTGHDYTFYPFATTNLKDFQNLMDVYLSSVLEPKLTYEDFLQEGWRLEPENLDLKDSPLTFKGVVYNEMKGQYSNSAYYYYIKFQEAIYASLGNSGGDPKDIVKLDYEDLIDFHSSNYHPSNAKTFTYGSMPLNDHLQKINEWYGTFGKRGISKKIKQPIFQKSDKNYISITCDGPFDSMNGKPIEEQYKASITWDLGNPLDELQQYNIFKWKILNSLLFDGHNAPLYQELIEKSYGDDFTSNAGLDNTTALLSITIGLENLTLSKVDGLEEKIQDIFKNKVVPELNGQGQGVFHERILAVLHQIELNFKKHKANFGLGLLNSVMPTWTNNLNPIHSLQVQHIINQFKEDYEKDGLKIFLDLIESSILLPTTKKFKFTMVPNANFEKELDQLEQSNLKQKTENLTEEDKDIIYKRSLELSEKQQIEQDASVLPTLTLADIPRKGDFHELQFTKYKASNIQKRVVDANGLSYMSAKKDISYLPSELIQYLPLFTSCLTNLAGTETYPITELETKIQQLTGGLSFSTQVVTDPSNLFSNKIKLNLVMDGMSLSSNLQHVYDLWYDILYNTKFDTSDDLVLEKLSTLIKNLGLNQLNTIADRGNVYASSYSNSLLTPTKYITDLKSGLGQIQFIKELNEKLALNGNDFLVSEVIPILQDIQNLLIGSAVESGFDYSILGDSASVDKNVKLIEKLEGKFAHTKLDILPSQLPAIVSLFDNNANGGVNTFINLPYQIGFASMAKVGSPYLTKDGATLQVLSQLVSNKHLHSIIREANGAYGGGLNYDGLGGVLNFYSYRDPNPLKSIQSFKDVSKVLLPKIDKNWDLNDLQEAKLAIFQSVDAPSNIALQGSSDFLRGITDEMKQQRREWFLDVTKEDLKDAASKYLVTGSEKEVVTVISRLEGFDLEGNWDMKDL